MPMSKKLLMAASGGQSAVSGWISYVARRWQNSGATLLNSPLSTALGPNEEVVSTGKLNIFYQAGAGGHMANGYLMQHGADGTFERFLQQSLGSSGSTFDGYANGIAMDSVGNTYITGRTDTTLTDGVIYTKKFDPLGRTVWNTTLSNSNWVRTSGNGGKGIALDDASNVYIVAEGDDRERSGIVVKYNVNGVLQWKICLVNTTSSLESPHLNDIVINSAGEIIVAGYDESPTPTATAFICKLNASTGALIWNTSGGDLIVGAGGVAAAVTVDSTDNIIISGWANTSNPLGLVAKYNTSGVLQWNRTLGDGQTLFFGVAIDSYDEIFAVGRSRATGTTAAYDNIIVAKYSSGGAIQWQRDIDHPTGTTTSSFTDCVVDSSDNLISTGYCNTQGGTAFSGRTDMMIVKLLGDGSQTGTHGDFVYSATTLLDSFVSNWTDVESPLNVSTNGTGNVGTGVQPSIKDVEYNFIAIP